MYLKVKKKKKQLTHNNKGCKHLKQNFEVYKKTIYISCSKGHPLSR